MSKAEQLRAMREAGAQRSNRAKLPDFVTKAPATKPNFAARFEYENEIERLTAEVKALKRQLAKQAIESGATKIGATKIGAVKPKPKPKPQRKSRGR